MKDERSVRVFPVSVQSKALRERWLLDGAPSSGPEQDEVKRQLEQDEAKTRSLEETINRSDLIRFNLVQRKTRSPDTVTQI